MTRATTGGGASRPSTSLNLSDVAFRLIGLALIDAVAIWLLMQMLADGVWILVTLLLIITIGINIVFLRPELYPLRWMSPGLALMLLMVVYPLVFTVYTAFTNYSDGHLLTKQQVIERITTGLQNMYVPEGGTTYSWVAFQAEDGTYALWLTDKEGNHYFAKPGEPIQPVTAGEGIFGPPDENGVPTSIEGYTRLNRIQAATNRDLPNIQFGEPPDAVQIRTPSEAAILQPRYVYDEELDAIIDQKEGKIYYANDEEGFFVSEDGDNGGICRSQRDNDVCLGTLHRLALQRPHYPLAQSDSIIPHHSLRHSRFYQHSRLAWDDEPAIWGTQSRLAGPLWLFTTLVF